MVVAMVASTPEKIGDKDMHRHWVTGLTAD